jgi:hypothetical protein
MPDEPGYFPRLAISAMKSALASLFIGTTEPRFSWKIRSIAPTARGIEQTASPSDQEPTA